MKKALNILLSILLILSIAGNVWLGVLYSDQKKNGEELASQNRSLSADFKENEAALTALKAEKQSLIESSAELNAKLAEQQGLLEEAAGQKLSAEQKCADLNAALTELQAQKEELTASLTAVQSELEALQQNLAAAEAANADQQVNAKELAANMASLTSQIEQKNNEIDSLSASIESLNSELAAAKSEETENKQRTEALTEEIAKLQTEKEALTYQVQDLTTEMEAAITAAQEQAEMFNGLSGQYDASKNSISSLESDKAALEATAAQLTAELANARALASDNQAVIAALTDEKATLDETIETLQAQLAQEKADLDAAARTAASDQAAIAALTDEKATLDETIETLQAQLAQKNADLDAAARTAAGDQAAIAALTDEKSSLQASINEMQLKLEENSAALQIAADLAADHQAAIIQLTNNNETLEAKLGTLQASLEETSAKLEAANALAAQNQASIDSLSDEKAALEATVDSLQTAITEKSAEIETANTLLAQKSAEAEELKKEKEEMDKTIAKLSATVEQNELTIAAQTADISAKAQSIAELAATLEQRDQAIDMLNDEVAELQAKLVAYSPNSLLSGDYTAGSLEAQAAELMDEGRWKEAQALLLAAETKEAKALLATCNDHCFLLDLCDGLKNRWSLSSEDTSAMSNQASAAHYKELIEAELSKLALYTSLQFSDSQLAAYAGVYINALYSQSAGIDAFTAHDMPAYYALWQEEGFERRVRMLYAINKSYDLTALSDQPVFEELIEIGQQLYISASVKNALSSQLLNLACRLTDATSKQVVFNGFTLTNTSDYLFSDITFKLNLLDADGHEAVSQQIYFGSAVTPGAAMKTGKLKITRHFAGFSIHCTVHVSGPSFRDTVEFTVKPLSQSSWDGKLTTADIPDQEIQACALLDIQSGWMEHSVADTALYSPMFAFTLQNNGKSILEQVIVRCEFIDMAADAVWSIETSHVVSSSDGALQPGEERGVFLYSCKGYKEALTNEALPAIQARVFVNDTLCGTYSIQNK